MTRNVTIWAGLLTGLALLPVSGVRADDCNPPPTCHCPPRFCHIMERPPCLKIRCGCPKPVCNPCDLPHAGFWPTCWRSWPYPPDWSHCPYPPPSTLIAPPMPGGHGPVGMAPPPVPEQPTLPAPKKEAPPELPKPRSTDS
jgi:hypothetical protein